MIPDRDFLTTIEDYQPKVSLELVERLMQQVGMHSSDQHVHKMISVMVEAQLCKILNEVKSVNLQQ